MTDTYDLTLYHDSEGVAAAIGALLSGRPSVEAVASQYDVAPETVTNAVISLGVEDQIAASLPDVEISCQQQERPAFLDQRDPVTRQKRGIRDDSTRAIVSDSYEISFERALLSEASQRAQEQVERHITDTLGAEADQLRVTVHAVPTNRDYPAQVRWIAVEYPIDDSDATTPTKVQSPPFPFARLEDALPQTVTVTVELDGESFNVHNIPVVATKEYWQ